MNLAVHLPEDQHADHKAEEDCQASHAGNRDLVHPPLVLRNIHRADLFGKHLDDRRSGKRHYRRAHKRQRDLQKKVWV